jgi:hypothetical protein
MYRYRNKTVTLQPKFYLSEGNGKGNFAEDTDVNP